MNDLKFCVKIPGKYQRPFGRANELVDLINFGAASEIRIDGAYFRKGGSKTQNHSFILKLSTHLNQIAGRMVFNSFEFMALYLANSLDKRGDEFDEMFIKN